MEKSQERIAVLWQSLVVPHYRSFWLELAKLSRNPMLLISPDRFRELGQQMVSCAPFEETKENIDFKKLKVWTLHTQCVFFLGLWKQVSQFFRKNNSPGHFLVMAEPYSITAFVAYITLRLSFRSKVKFYTYALQNIRKDFPFPLGWIQTFLFRKCEAVLVLGREQEEVLRQQGYRGKTMSFPLWFDSQNFDLTSYEDAYQKLQDRIGPQDNKQIKLAYVGSYFKEKGIDDLFDSLTYAEDLKTTLSILLVGAGPEKEHVTRRVSKLQAEGWMIKEIGSLPQTDLKYFYNLCDILVIPSRTAAHWKEQFGRVIVEAEACGCVAIGSNSGAIPEVIGDSERVFLENNPEDLAKVLKRSMERLSGESSATSRSAVRKKIIDRFSDKCLAALFYKDLEKE